MDAGTDWRGGCYDSDVSDASGGLRGSDVADRWTRLQSERLVNGRPSVVAEPLVDRHLCLFP